MTDEQRLYKSALNKVMVDSLFYRTELNQEIDETELWEKKKKYAAFYRTHIFCNCITVFEINGIISYIVIWLIQATHSKFTTKRVHIYIVSLFNYSYITTWNTKIEHILHFPRE